MKPRLLLPATVLLATLLAVTGCPRGEGPKKDVKAKEKETEASAVKMASELAAQATDISHYRDALRLLEGALNKPETIEKYRLTANAKAVLKEKLGLSDDQIAALDQPSFSQLDAYFLDDTFLLRDAMRQLSLPDAKQEERPAFVMDWIARKVVLHEQHDEHLPPVWTLRRGFGTALGRSLIFVRMMRQVGCDVALVTPAESAEGSGPWLLAAQTTPETSNFVFLDPRLAKVIVGPDGNKPATWEEMRKNPKLLEASGFEEKQAANLEVRLVCSEHEIAPRMHFVEKTLEMPGEPLYLHQDPEAMQRHFATLGAVKFWQASANSANPIFRLRRFISKEDGGSDETKRQQRFQAHRIPYRLFAQMRRFKLAEDQFVEEGSRTLQNLLTTLYIQYGLKPEEMMLHGKSDDALERINRIKPLLEEAEFGEPPLTVSLPIVLETAKPLGLDLQPLTPDLAAAYGIQRKTGLVVTQVAADSIAEKAGFKGEDVITKVQRKLSQEKTATVSPTEPAEFNQLFQGKEVVAEVTVLRGFGQLVADWREALRRGYLAKARKEPNAQQMLNHLWSEDQYALALQQPNIEMPKVEKKLLTRLLGRMLRDSLGPQTTYVVGHAWEDKAERLLARGGASENAKKESLRAWANARAAWARHLDRNRMSAKSLADRMEALAAEVSKGQLAAAVAIESFELLHLDLHESLEAQLQFAEAQNRTGMGRQAAATLENLRSDLGDAKDVERIRKVLETFAALTRPGDPFDYRRRAAFLLRDWQEKGNIYWTSRRAEESLARLKQP